MRLPRHLLCVVAVAACNIVKPTYVDDEGDGGGGSGAASGTAGNGGTQCRASDCPGGPGAVGVCVDDACAIECAPDRGDCNDDLVTDGCEIDFLTDDEHCGDCDTACTLGCIDGLCNGPVELEVGFLSACARLADGTVWCWGHNGQGEVGDGTMAPVHAPKQVPLPDKAKRIASGGNYATALSCAILEDDTAMCWGDSSYDGNPTAGGPPTPVTALANVKKISIGDGQVCALKNDGELLCWGKDDYGQVGNGLPLQTEPLPTPIATGIADVSAGMSHTCAAETDGDLFCWGMSQYDQLGIPGSPDVSVPTEVALDGVVMVSVGTFNSCAMKTDEVYCWGWDYNAGVGTQMCTGSIDSPILIAVGEPVAIFAEGREEGAAVAGTDHHLALWGIGPHPSGNPIMGCGVNNYDAMVDLVSVGHGETTTCVLLADRTVSCWGDDTDGLVGDGLDTETYKPDPTPVVFAPP